ncbi:hypothetical protein BCR34DRAFT_136874 [Clohesyomyces aquaticus]|uniref:Secreted protein n=1 Tax=Clohesyomyces aquaticus TaxID=1231657 RepID=A0A1Y2A0N7_9PLEO|nr:hypothetical protein BCR34DRAFT_136874 [Clohesyomyces aquaticus]
MPEQAPQLFCFHFVTLCACNCWPFSWCQGALCVRNGANSALSRMHNGTRTQYYLLRATQPFKSTLCAYPMSHRSVPLALGPALQTPNLETPTSRLDRLASWRAERAQRRVPRVHVARPARDIAMRQDSTHPMWTRLPANACGHISRLTKLPREWPLFLLC